MNKQNIGSTQENLVKNSTFTDKDGNASTEDWTTNTASVPIRIPGGKHKLALNARDFITQPIQVAHNQNFKVHYCFLAAASNPSPATYIRVKVENDLIKEEVDIVVNNKVLHLRTHTGSRTFSAQGGPLQLTLSNEVLNTGRFIELTEIQLWIEPVHE